MAAGDIKQCYDTITAITCTIDSLAQDTSLLAGRCGAVIDNSSNKFVDYLITGVIKTGGTATANSCIEIWIYSNIDSTPNYPDTLLGTDAAKTLTNSNIKYSGLRNLTTITITSATNTVYPFANISVASLFGGKVPKYFGIFVTHNTGGNLYASGHAIYYTPVYYSVAQS